MTVVHRWSLTLAARALGTARPQANPERICGEMLRAVVLLVTAAGLTAAEESPCGEHWVCPSGGQEVCGQKTVDDKVVQTTRPNKCHAICNGEKILPGGGECMDEIIKRNTVCREYKDDFSGCQAHDGCEFLPTPCSRLTQRGGVCRALPVAGDATASQ